MRSLLWVYPKNLAEALDRSTWIAATSGLTERNWAVTVATAGARPRELPSAVDAALGPDARAYGFGYVAYHAWILSLLFRRKQPDVVVFHQDSALPLLLATMIVPKRFRPTMVMDIRTVPMHSGDWKAYIQGLRFKLGQWLANRTAEGQLAISDEIAALVGVRADRLLGIWPSAVDTKAFKEATPTEPTESLRIVYVGRLSAERNLVALCEAAGSARLDGVPVTLTLIGDGPQRADLNSIIERRWSDIISIIGPVGISEVAGLLAKAHFGVLPFPDDERFRVSSPLKLFEYLAAGLPVLATRIECHTKVIVDDRAVVWAHGSSVDAIKAAIVSAWTCRKTWAQSSRAARGLSSKHDWSYSIDRLAEALDRLELPNGILLEPNAVTKEP